MSHQPPPDPTGQQPTPPAAYQPTDAIAYGWRRFVANPLPYVVVVLVALVASMVLQLIGSLASGGLSGGGTDRILGVVPAHPVGLLMQLLATLVGWVVAAALARGALDTTAGSRPQVGDFFTRIPWGPVLLAALIAGVLSTIGYALLVIPGLIVSFLLMFTNLFIVDQQMPALDALRASVQLVTQNLGPTLLFALLAFVIVLLGACLCGVGLLVAVPVAQLGLAYTYRTLHQMPVA